MQAARRYHERREAEELQAREARRREWLEKVRTAVHRIAPDFPAVARVDAYGSLVTPGRFSPRSDLDLAVDCDDLEQEGRFWRALEQTLRRDVDLRPRRGPIAQAVALYGIKIYERSAATLPE